MLSPSSVSESFQDGITAYKTSGARGTHRAWQRRKAGMIKIRHQLLAVWAAAWQEDPNTRPKDFNASLRAGRLSWTTGDGTIRDRQAAVKPRESNVKALAPERD